MKDFVARIWNSPATTFAGATVAGVTALLGAWVDAPPSVIIAGATVAAFVGFFAKDPSKQ